MSNALMIRQIETGVPRMAEVLPALPVEGTRMVRLIRLVGGALGDYFEPIFRDYDIAEHGFHVLCLLLTARDESASPSELSEMIGTSRANMSRILVELEKEGWIERASAQRDRRRQHIRITPQGRAKADAVAPVLTQPILRAFAMLEPQEMEVLAKLLTRLASSLDEASWPTANAA